MIRPAVDEDIHDVFNWRNDPQARAMFISEAHINFADHESWYSAVIRSNDSMVLIGELDDHKVGICRFDGLQGDKRADVSINLNPAMRSRGLGKILLADSISYFRRNHTNQLSAQIKRINTISYRLFAGCGFSRLDEDLDLIYMFRGD